MRRHYSSIPAILVVARRIIICGWIILMALLLNSSTAAATEAAAPDRVFRAEKAVMAESSIIDKETGRIFWEGGKTSTLSESIHKPLASLHIAATLLTCMLVMVFWGILADWMGNWLPILEEVVSQQPRRRPLLILQATVLSLGRLVSLLPRFPSWFTRIVTVFYLLEAYSCPTRQYLANMVDNVDEYITTLRASPMTVEWKVRSFHYEHLLPSRTSSLRSKDSKDADARSGLDEEEEEQLSSLRRRKRVTQRATGSYQYKHCKDHTVAGVWKKASNLNARFTKIDLIQTLILKDAKARADYIKQQQLFLQEHHNDEYAEFSTRLQLPGFRPRLLLVRNSHWFFQSILFWIFTFFGLTVPYRHWFAQHCDQIRVTVVKEVSVDRWFHSRRKDEDVDSRSTNNSSILPDVLLAAPPTPPRPRTPEEEQEAALIQVEVAEAAAVELALRNDNNNSTEFDKELKK